MNTVLFKKTLLRIETVYGSDKVDDHKVSLFCKKWQHLGPFTHTYLSAWVTMQMLAPEILETATTVE